MNKAVPWSIKGVDFDAREAAKEAARRAGMSLGEWLNSIIAERAAETGLQIDDVDETARLEAVTARLAHMSARPERGHPEESAPQIDWEAEETGRETPVRRRPAPPASRREKRPPPPVQEAPFIRPPRSRPPEYFAERPVVADPEALLDEAIRSFERGTKRSNERTTAAISHVARRLEDIEHRLAAPVDDGQESLVREALSRLETRIETLARRNDNDRPERSLRELERRLAEMAQEMSAKSEKADKADDIARIEAKLNRLIDTVAAPQPVAVVPPAAPVATPEPATPSAPPVAVRPPLSRGGIEEAVAQITRRQRHLDAEAPASAPRQGVPASKPAVSSDISGLQKEIASLTARLDGVRQDFKERATPATSPDVDLLRRRIDELANGFARLAPREAIVSLEKTIKDLGDRMGGAPQPGIRESLLRPIEELATDVRRSMVAFAPHEGFARLQRDIQAIDAKMAPPDALAGLEGAIKELGERVAASRQTGLREVLLRPIEDLAADVRRSVGALAPHEGFVRLQRDIQAIDAKIEGVRDGLASPALDDLQSQMLEIRKLLTAASTQPAPVERIEKQVAQLANRVEQIAHRGGSQVDAAAVVRSIGEIRATLVHGQQPELVDKLAARIEEIGRKIDEVATRQASAAAMDTSVLERMMRELASKIDRPAVASATAEDARRIEELVQSLGARLDQHAVTHDEPAAIHGIRAEIAGLAGRIDEAVSRAMPHDQIESLSQRLDLLQRSVTDRPEMIGAGVETAALEDMMRELSDKFEGVHAGASEPRLEVDLLGELKRHMADLAARIDARPPADTGAVRALHDDIGRLAQRLDTADQTSQVLESIETSIADLSRRVEDAARAAVDAAESAGRDAARETLRESGAHASGMPAVGLDHELANLRAKQDAADRRTHATLTAVHETLEKVVDRLAVIEDEFSEVRPEPLATGPAPIFKRPPPAMPSLELPPRAEVPRPPEPVFRDPERKSAPPVPPAATSDELIEPGSGIFPERRAAPRAFTNEEIAGGDADLAAEKSAQANFIAAARRAAQVAATHTADDPPAKARAPARPANSVEAALEEARARARAAHTAAMEKAETGPADVGPLARVMGFVTSRRRPLVVGLVGTGMVLASLQALKVYSGTTSLSELAHVAASKNVSHPALPVEAAAPAEKSAAAIPAAAPAAAEKLQQSAAALPTALSPDPISLGTVSGFISGAKPPATGAFDTSPVGSIAAPPMGATETALRNAAQAGSADAAFELATRYAEGRTVPRDQRQALAFFQKAADQNVAPAQYRLGMAYERGLGVDRDLKRAAEWYQKAADAGNIRAMHNLAVLSAQGIDGKPDYATAATWFSKASEYGVRDSQYNLAILLARGLGTEQNLPQSWAWFSIAAAQGDDDAGKKRDDVAGRLDDTQMASAKAILAAFKPRTPTVAANEVAPPPGGWDALGRGGKPSAAAVPAAKSPTKRKMTSL